MRHAHSNFDLSIEETRGLSEQGWKDAKRVTDVLLEEGIEVVASSSYVRAIQTVQETADNLGVEVIVDPRLRERATLPLAHAVFHVKTSRA
ncbi:histidine phosphatase family protein [Tumebacillus avium]|uniref:histidine phosphatase family protein n=1 Tax=Tumebacillus avium TaxID=1903704 RepID=UPI0038CD266B